LSLTSSTETGDMSLPLRDPDPHTYGDYRGWPDDERFELIDGAAYAMAPAPTRQHQRLVGELFRVIADALEDGDCEVNVAPFDVRLPDADEADDRIASVVQPDISVVCDPGKLDDKGCRGAPDWIVEVLSPRTAGHDQVRKLALYERHRVREYWLVHPVDLVVTIYRLERDGYGRPTVQELTGQSISSACPAVEVDWAAVLNGVPPASDGA
jgi:Uma2 family endonuclease